jgi:organic radical activating enzyme
MQIQEIYPTFQGEQNYWGIGAPVIFVRTKGCKIRCYLKTMGTLCDTPKALEFDKKTEMSNDEILSQCLGIKDSTGIDLICLSGGDPLHRPVDEVVELLIVLLPHFKVSVETSGIDVSVKSIRQDPRFYPFRKLIGQSITSNSHLENPVLQNLSFVVDYKGKSAGIPKSDERNMLRRFEEAQWLCYKDFIKFVIYDTEDFQEFLEVLPLFTEYGLRAKIVVGSYWGAKLTPRDLFELLKFHKLCGKVKLNFQVHKLVLSADPSKNFDHVQI